LIFDSTHIGQLMIKDPDILTRTLSLEIITEKGLIFLNADDAIQLTQHSTTRIALSGSLTSVNTALEVWFIPLLLMFRERNDLHCNYGSWS
jgi:hypothetical protein